MSNKAEKRGLVPRLRFPEFREAGEWNKEKLGTIAKLYKGKGISKAEIVANGIQPCIRYGELYTIYGETIHEIVSSTSVDASELFLSKKNDVIIPASGETKIDIAKASCVMSDDIALGSDLNVIRSNQNGIFLSYQLNGPLRLSIAKVAQGDTVVHLYPTQIERLDVLVPCPIEQQKIAECVTSLDELITLAAQKLDTLKTHKKGLMQQLFPAEGETLPKLRFPEFQDEREWQKRKISSLLLKSVNPLSVEIEEAYREIGIRSHGKGIFHKEPVLGKALGDKRVFRVEENAFVLNIVFAWEQAVAVTSAAERGMIASHRFPMYKPDKHKSDVNFIKYFFLTRKGKELLGIASPGGAGRNKTLGQKEFESLEFLSPERVEEQTAIARCLSSLDNLITVQTQKLAALKTHKKGLMQQLFPALGEAPA